MLLFTELLIVKMLTTMDRRAKNIKIQRLNRYKKADILLVKAQLVPYVNGVLGSFILFLFFCRTVVFDYQRKSWPFRDLEKETSFFNLFMYFTTNCWSM